MILLQSAGSIWDALVRLVGAVAGTGIFLFLVLALRTARAVLLQLLLERQSSDSMCSMSFSWMRASAGITAVAGGSGASKKGQAVQARTLCASVVVVYHKQACVLLPGCVCHVSG